MQELLISSEKIFWKGKYQKGTIIKNENEINFESNVLRGRYLEGWVNPGLVNAHCHLELSHLGKISHEIKGKGMAQFILWVQKNRNQNIEWIEKKIQKVLTNFQNEGTFFIADVCNSLITKNIKNQFSKIHFINFWEVFGLNPRMDNIKWTEIQENAKKLNALITLHAPYSCSKELIQRVHDNYPKLQSIHMAESIEEMDYFSSNESEMYQVFREMKIPDDFLQQKLPFSEAILSNKTENYLLVHNVFLEIKRIPKEILEKCYFCICPTSNLFLHGKTVSKDFIIEFVEKICLGTDSLASNDQLSIIKEMNYLKSLNIETTSIIAMATLNAYKALQIDLEILEKYEHAIVIHEKNNQFIVKHLW
jgi:cytosine/adenosine deaminase-related metal-dependent hydrolase